MTDEYRCGGPAPEVEVKAMSFYGRECGEYTLTKPVSVALRQELILIRPDAHRFVSIVFSGREMRINWEKR